MFIEQTEVLDPKGWSVLCRDPGDDGATLAIQANMNGIIKVVWEDTETGEWWTISGHAYHVPKGMNAVDYARTLIKP